MPLYINSIKYVVRTCASMLLIAFTKSYFLLTAYIYIYIYIAFVEMRKKNDGMYT